MSETLAARMRAAYVGDDAIAFDELKPEVRARWERVAAVGRVPFSDAQIERMAKAADECYSESWGTTWLDAIRAALAAGGLEPCAVPEYKPEDMALSKDAFEAQIIKERDIARERLARASQWLASYAAAHGCPVGLPQLPEGEVRYGLQGMKIDPEWLLKKAQQEDGCFTSVAGSPTPIASAETLEQLAEIAEAEEEATDSWVCAVEKVLRAAQAYVDVDRQQQVAQKMKEIWGDDEFVAWLNSRIRYRVALPETPKGLPTRREGGKILWNGINYNDQNEFDGPRFDDYMLGYDAILTALRPWLREPTGWELDVTEDEAFAAWRQHESPDYKLSMQAVLDLCRSRIRPTFECKECASGEDSWYRVSAAVDGIQAAVTAARAALEGE